MTPRLEPLTDPIGDALQELAAVAIAWDERSAEGRPAPILRRALVGAAQDLAARVLAEMVAFGAPVDEDIASSPRVPDPYAEAKAAWLDGELEMLTQDGWKPWVYHTEPTFAPPHCYRRATKPAPTTTEPKQPGNWAMHDGGLNPPKILRGIYVKGILVHAFGDWYPTGIEDQFQNLDWRRITHWRLVTNPYTGERRKWRDVHSDPAGLAIVRPGDEVKAAPTIDPVRAAIELLGRELTNKAYGWVAGDACSSSGLNSVGIEDGHYSLSTEGGKAFLGQLCRAILQAEGGSNVSQS